MSFLSTGNREEVITGPIRQGWEEEEALTKFRELQRLPCYERNIAAGNAQIGQFTIRELAKLANRLPVTAPVTIIADQVHQSCSLGLCGL